jgi:cytochrome c553
MEFKGVIFWMERKRMIRTLITASLVVALIAVIYVSQQYDPTNPHATVSKETWLHGPKGHGYAVLNNQAPWKQCYTCHEKKGYGGQEFCVNCHDKSGVKVVIPQKPL